MQDDDTKNGRKSPDLWATIPSLIAAMSAFALVGEVISEYGQFFVAGTPSALAYFEFSDFIDRSIKTCLPASILIVGFLYFFRGRYDFLDLSVEGFEAAAQKHTDKSQHWRLLAIFSAFSAVGIAGAFHYKPEVLPAIFGYGFSGVIVIAGSIILSSVFKSHVSRNTKFVAIFVVYIVLPLALFGVLGAMWGSRMNACPDIAVLTLPNGKVMEFQYVATLSRGVVVRAPGLDTELFRWEELERLGIRRCIL